MIVVEGADLVGKTTLCKKIVDTEYCRLHGMIYSHFTRLPEGWEHPRHYYEHVRQRVVQDRFHMSEPVYAEVRGDGTKLTPERYRLVDAQLRLAGAVIVVITDRTGDVIKSRWQDGEMYSLPSVLNANEYFIRVVRGTFWVDYRADWDFALNVEDLTDDAHCAHIVGKITELHAQRRSQILSRRGLTW